MYHEHPQGRWRVIRRARASLWFSVLVAAFVSSWGVGQPAGAQVLEQRAWINGASSSGDHFGTSVAISGYTLIAGSPDRNGIGSASVFVRTGGTWVGQQRLTPFDGLPGDGFGTAVAIDGDTAVVGAPERNNFEDAVAYVFTRSGTTWSLQQQLKPTAAGYGFGVSVGISGDTAIFGTSGTGMGAHVYVRSGSVWSHQQHLDEDDAGAIPNAAIFGYSVSVSGDSILIGGYTHSAFVFVRSAGVWSLQDELVSLNPNAVFERSVWISGDTAIVGDDGSTGGGSASVFARTGTSWSSQGFLTAPDGVAWDGFGTSVALSRDYAVVGAHHHAHTAGVDAGAAYLFRRRGANWEFAGELLQSAPMADDRFGASVALEGDMALVGAPQNDWVNIVAGTVTDGGSVYEFLPYLFADGFESDSAP